jgi:hypothetical protein
MTPFLNRLSKPSLRSAIYLNYSDVLSRPIELRSTRRSTLRGADLERVDGTNTPRNSQVTGLRGVDLERVGGGTGANSDWRVKPWSEA